MVQSAGQQGARDEGGRHHSSLAAPTQRIRQHRGVGVLLAVEWFLVTQGKLPSRYVNCLGKLMSFELPYQCLTRMQRFTHHKKC